eukprot:1155136-Pelagomonas_calceolata.AAC.1
MSNHLQTTNCITHQIQVGGLLLVAPEHRLSLQLKRDELWGHDHAVCAMLDKLSAMPYIDIIDENDVMLHHRMWQVNSAA